MTDRDSAIEGFAHRCPEFRAQAKPGRLLESEKYSDLTLICQGVLFKVHCAIVCTQSPFFAAAVDGKFKVRTILVILTARLIRH